MAGKKQLLSKESLGNKVFTCTAGVSLEADGTFELTLASVNRTGKTDAANKPPPFKAPDLAGLETQAGDFLEEWKRSEKPDSNQVVCCTKVVQNAFTRARAKLDSLSRPPVQRTYGRGR